MPLLHRRVLLIDDDEDIQMIGRVALESLAGWHVEVASSGEAGLALACSGRFDVIVLDVSMVGWDGPRTLRELQANPATQALPVVFLTARVQDRERAAFLEAGAVGVLQKPFEVATLASSIDALLSGP